MNSIEKMQKVMIVTTHQMMGVTMPVTSIIDFRGAEGCILNNDPAKGFLWKSVTVDPEFDKREYP